MAMTLVSTKTHLFAYERAYIQIGNLYFTLMNYNCDEDENKQLMN